MPVIFGYACYDCFFVLGWSFYAFCHIWSYLVVGKVLLYLLGCSWNLVYDGCHDSLPIYLMIMFGNFYLWKFLSYASIIYKDLFPGSWFRNFYRRNFYLCFMRSNHWIMTKVWRHVFATSATLFFAPMFVDKRTYIATFSSKMLVHCSLFPRSIITLFHLAWIFIKHFWSRIHCLWWVKVGLMS